nr:unnamed protein product [Callosobruchus analis]
MMYLQECLGKFTMHVY